MSSIQEQVRQEIIKNFDNNDENLYYLGDGTINSNRFSPYCTFEPISQKYRFKFMDHRYFHIIHIDNYLFRLKYKNMLLEIFYSPIEIDELVINTLLGKINREYAIPNINISVVFCPSGWYRDTELEYILKECFFHERFNYYSRHKELLRIRPKHSFM